LSSYLLTSAIFFSGVFPSHSRGSSHPRVRHEQVLPPPSRADNIFSDNDSSTISVNFKIKTITSDGKTVKPQACDTAGKERFPTFNASYHRVPVRRVKNIIAYHIIDQDSFDHVGDCVKEIDQLDSTRQMSVRSSLKTNQSLPKNA
jgi:hypothetical protein